jgi:hypothetical protein
MMRAFLLAGVIAFLPSIGFAEEGKRQLTIQSTPLRLNVGQSQEKGIGKLIFRGSIRLTSSDKDFGGLSALHVSDDRTHFLAISDVSHWVTGTLSYTDGKLTGVAGSEIGPLRDLKGHPLEGKDGDAEGVAVSSATLTAYVSFERDHRIWAYDIDNNALDMTPHIVTTPPELSHAPSNSGLEGIALLHDGRLLALTEDFKDSNGNLHGWLIPTGSKGKIEPLALKPRGPYELTDVRELANHDILTLERRFSRMGGVGFEMRRIAAKDVVPGAVLDGEVVADAGMTYVIDNMEGLSVNRGPNGETLIYIISDDNFNHPLQQTMLMMFELTP